MKHFEFKELKRGILSQYGTAFSPVPLSQKRHKLLDMLTKDFRSTTQFPGIIERIVAAEPNYTREQVWSLYEEVFSHYSSALFYAITRVLIYDLFDVFVPINNFLISNSAYYKLNPYFRGLCDHYLRILENQGFDHGISRVAMMSQFFNFLEQRGHQTLESVMLDDIHAYAELKGMQNTSYAVLARQMEVCCGYDPDSNRIAGMFPRGIGRKKKPLKPLTEEECERVIDVLCNPDSGLPPIPRAVGCLGMFTGLRVSNCINLREEDIDRKNQVVICTQVKTGKEIRIPLAPIVFDAIIDAVEVRPRCNSTKLFVEKTRKNMDPIPLRAASVTKQIFRAAGLDPDRGKGGFHLLRHAFATRLLKSGQSREFLREYLGHTYASAATPYIDLTLSDVAQCALDISNYPIQSKHYEGIQ